MTGSAPWLRPNTGMNTKVCNLKYTASTLTAVCEKPIRIPFMPAVITEVMDCMTMPGRPTR